MADFFQTGVYGGSGNNDLTVADHTNALGPGTSTNFDTGDLRRNITLVIVYLNWQLPRILFSAF